jgi:hypothetical protein
MVDDLKIEPLQLRAWTYERLRQGKTGSQEMQILDLALYVRSKAIDAGILDSVPFVANYDIPSLIADPLRELVWQLIIQGIIVPGVGIGGATRSAELPLFQITEWGKRCLECGEFLPYDTGQFVNRLRMKVPSVDEVVVLYMTEALQSFRGGTYLASAVIVGVASEKVLLNLRDAIESALDTPQKKQRFAADTKAKSIKRIHDTIQKRLDPVMQRISTDLNKEDISAELSGIFDLIRKTRNDAGHPTGRIVEREEAFGLLQLFPSHCQVSHDVIGWLKTQKI